MNAIGQFWQKVTPAQLKRILIAVLMLTLVPVSVMLVTQQGAVGGRSGGGWQSPASIFAARSPGRRLDGLVFWVKQRLRGGTRTGALSRARERVLPVTRARPAARVLFQPDAPFGLSGAPSAIGVAASGEILGFAPAVPAFAAPGFDGLFDLPPSPSLSERDEQKPPLPPSPAVPELATWLQMVLAIATLGLAMRRGHGAEARASQAASTKSGLPSAGHFLPDEHGTRAACAVPLDPTKRLLIAEPPHLSSPPGQSRGYRANQHRAGGSPRQPPGILTP